MNELTRMFRLANRVIAIMAPVLVVGVLLLRNVNEDLMHAFGLAWYFLNFAILFVLDERARRDRRRDQ